MARPKIKVEPKINIETLPTEMTDKQVEEILSGVQSTARGNPEATLRPLPNLAFSLIELNNNYTLVEVAYDPATGEARVNGKTEFGRDKAQAKENFKLKVVRTQSF